MVFPQILKAVTYIILHITAYCRAPLFGKDVIICNCNHMQHVEACKSALRKNAQHTWYGFSRQGGLKILYLAQVSLHLLPVSLHFLVFPMRWQKMSLLYIDRVNVWTGLLGYRYVFSEMEVFKGVRHGRLAHLGRCVRPTAHSKR